MHYVACWIDSNGNEQRRDCGNKQEAETIVSLLKSYNIVSWIAKV